MIAPILNTPLYLFGYYILLLLYIIYYFINPHIENKIINPNTAAIFITPYYLFFKNIILDLLYHYSNTY